VDGKVASQGGDEGSQLVVDATVHPVSTEIVGQDPIDPRQYNPILVVVAACVPAALYMLFVVHYSVNVPLEDDWTIVPLIHSAIHGRLTFGALWALHDENRILIPNLIFVAVGVFAHDNLRVLVVLSGVIFIASFLGLLVLVRSYQKRRMTPLLVLVLGVVWFSLNGWSGALWAFQITWYVILFLLIAMLYLLLEAKHRTAALILAVLAAAAASFSFVQGMGLWPVGLICLAWDLPVNPRRWRRRNFAELAVWIVAGVSTILAALWGYHYQNEACNVGGSFQFACSGSVISSVLHHPITTIQFLLVEMGSVVPNLHVRSLWPNGLLGAILLVAAGWVVVRSIRSRHDGRNCLPVGLLAFGFVFDVFIAAGRESFLSAGGATSTTVAMPNLIILLAILIYGWTHLKDHYTPSLGVLLAIFLIAQLALGTQEAISGAISFDQRQSVAARLVVNLDRIPESEKGCYLFYGEFGYLLFTPDVGHFVGFADARTDHLTVFSPGLYRKYRALGLPVIGKCK
jgi:hypothetical protein